MANPIRSRQREAIFAAEYVKHFNGSRAALAAGYADGPGIGVTASRLLKNAKVSALIDKKLAEIKKNNRVTMDWVIQELMKIANADLRDAYDREGNLLPIHLLPDSIAAAIEGIEVVEMAGGMSVANDGQVRHIPLRTKKIKKIDKSKALELLGRYFGGFTDNVNTNAGGAQINFNFPPGYKPKNQRTK